MNDVLTSLTGLAAGMDTTTIVLAVLFGSVLIVVLAGSALVAPKDAVERRLEAAGDGRILPGVVPIRHMDEREAMKGMNRLFAPSDQAERSRMRLKLIRAGYRDASALRNYYLIRGALGIGLALPVILIYVFWSISIGVEVGLGRVSGSLPSSFWVVIALVLLGFYGPPLVLTHQIQKRQEAIRNGFPDALDMLLVSVEAGLGLDAAIQRIAAELGPAHPIIAEEFAIVGLETRAGKARSEVLRDMAERIGVDEVSSLVTVLNQSARFGTSVAEALRVYASDMRLTRMMRAEEKANKLPVKLSVAVVLFMLPAMFAVILGPIGIKVVRILLPAVGGN